MAGANYDVTQVCFQFQRHKLPGQADDLISLRRAALGSRNWALLLAEIADACLKAEATPVQCMQTMMVYGAAIGIQLERERNARRGGTIAPFE